MAMVPDIAPDPALVEVDEQNLPLPTMFDHIVTGVDLKSKTAGFLRELVRKSLPGAELQQVTRFGNRLQWERFHMCKSQVAERNAGDANVRLAFHGTPDPKCILGDGLGNRDGFHPAFSKGGSYGHGMYFVEHAAYPVLIHPKTHLLLVAEVVLGAVKDYGDADARDLKGPPVREPALRLHYDSVRGTEKGIGLKHATNRLEFGTQVVLYERGQAYPHYLVALRVNTCVPSSPSAIALAHLTPGRKVALYSWEHRRYAQMNRDFAMVSLQHPDADPLKPGMEWEAFVVADGGNGQIALYNSKHRRFVRMKRDKESGKHDVDGKAGAMDILSLPEKWLLERWIAKPTGRGKVSLYNPFNKRFMCMMKGGVVCGDGDAKAEADGSLQGDPDSSRWEQFIVIPLD